MRRIQGKVIVYVSGLLLVFASMASAQTDLGSLYAGRDVRKEILRSPSRSLEANRTRRNIHQYLDKIVEVCSKSGDSYYEKTSYVENVLQELESAIQKTLSDPRAPLSDQIYITQINDMIDRSELSLGSPINAMRLREMNYSFYARFVMWYAVYYNFTWFEEYLPEERRKNMVPGDFPHEWAWKLYSGLRCLTIPGSEIN